MKIKCDYCGKIVEKSTGHVNRAKKNSADLFCNRVCSSNNRKQYKSLDEKKAEKAAYDKEYRKKNFEIRKVKKAAYFQRTYDPAKAAVERKKRSAQHAEYCRQPEYKAWKKRYDRIYKAKKNYGEFWECALIAEDLRRACVEIMPKYEIGLINGTINKAQTRKRHAGIKR